MSATLADVAVLLDRSRGDTLSMQGRNGWVYIVFRRGKFAKIVVRCLPACLEEGVDEMVGKIAALNARAA